MEDFDEEEVHTVVHPEYGDWRKVWSALSVKGDTQGCRGTKGPARDVARVLLESDQVSLVPSWGGRSQGNPN